MAAMFQFLREKFFVGEGLPCVHSEHNNLIICWKQLDATTVDANLPHKPVPTHMPDILV